MPDQVVERNPMPLNEQISNKVIGKGRSEGDGKDRGNKGTTRESEVRSKKLGRDEAGEGNKPQSKIMKRVRFKLSESENEHDSAADPAPESETPLGTKLLEESKPIIERKSTPYTKFLLETNPPLESEPPRNTDSFTKSESVHNSHTARHHTPKSNANSSTSAPSPKSKRATPRQHTSKLNSNRSNTKSSPTSQPPPKSKTPTPQTPTTKPESIPSSPPTPLPDDGWYPIYSPTAKAYYFHNRTTNKTQWTNPRVPNATSTAPPSHSSKIKSHILSFLPSMTTKPTSKPNPHTLPETSNAAITQAQSTARSGQDLVNRLVPVTPALASRKKNRAPASTTDAQALTRQAVAGVDAWSRAVVHAQRQVGTGSN